MNTAGTTFNRRTVMDSIDYDLLQINDKKRKRDFDYSNNERNYTVRKAKIYDNDDNNRQYARVKQI